MMDVRILVVEDDLKIASFVAGGLRQHGFAVDLARDGDEALALVATTRLMPRSSTSCCRASTV